MPSRMTQEEFELRVKEYTKDTVKVISNYVNKKTPVKIQCKKCGYKWNISPLSLMPSSTKNYNFKGCPECKYDICQCDECGKTFKRLKSILNKTNLHFCSKECGNRYKNKQVINIEEATNYRRNAFLKYPHKCAICSWNKDEDILEVHHIDENRNNNHISNLIILCPICHKYLTLHKKTLQEMLNKE